MIRLKKIIFLISLVIHFLTMGAYSYAAEKAKVAVKSQPQPVIIDTDMAFDDWGAILFLLNSKKVEVKGIAVSGTGEAHCDVQTGNIAGATNALDLLKLAGKEKLNIPVACGQSMPTQGKNVFPDAWRKESDNLSDIVIPKSKQKLYDGDAVDLITTLLEKSKQKMKILAIGPMTNLGPLLQDRPDLKKKIASIVIMGGAVRVPGNLKATGAPATTNLFAEWNVFIDPYAMQQVVASGVPIELISLDGTNDVPITLEFLHNLQLKMKTPSARFVFEELLRAKDIIKTGDLYFWDSLAAAALVEPSLCKFEVVPLSVNVQKGPENGRTYLDEKHGYPISLCVSAKRNRFESILLHTLNAH